MKKPLNRWLLALALGLASAGPALAACDVTLSSILPNGQAVLKANCGATPVTGINWFQDGNSLTGGDLALSPAVNNTDIFYTVPLIFSNAIVHSYTATGNAGAIAAGAPVTIAIAPPALNVSVSLGGTVASTPAGINACKNGSGTCLATYAPGATVSLTATADSGFVFSGWGGDCSGTAICTVGMTSVRTVAATFGPVPTSGACGTPGASATSPTTGLCSAGTAGPVTNASNTWSWTCAGLNGGTASPTCSAPQIVPGACGSASGTTPLSAAPSGTAACSTGNVASMVTGASNFTWSCNGINGGANVTTCSAPVAATDGECGSANTTNTATSPTGSALCTKGSPSTVTNTNFTYSWTCNGLGGSTVSPSCSANQTVNGACGSSSGGSFASAPATNLCVAGNNPTAVSGSGPWTWGCNGINGGTNTTGAACSASLSGGGGGGGATDPGRWTGLWIPPTLADGSANTGGPSNPVLVVADPSAALGVGNVTYVPGCINQIDPNTSTACKAAGYYASGGTTVNLAVGRIVSIRYRSSGTTAGGFFRVYNKDGAAVYYSVTISLSAIPGDFNVAANCQATGTANPQVNFGVINGKSYCSPPYLANTPYYVNIKVNSPACSGTSCNFKIVESSNLQ